MNVSMQMTFKNTLIATKFKEAPFLNRKKSFYVDDAKMLRRLGREPYL